MDILVVLKDIMEDHLQALQEVIAHLIRAMEVIQVMVSNLLLKTLGLHLPILMEDRVHLLRKHQLQHQVCYF